MSGTLDVEEICEAWKAQVDAAGLNASLNVYAFPPAHAAMQLPALVLEPAAPFINYLQTHGASGSAELNFEQALYVAPPAGQIDAYLATYRALGIGTDRSVFAAVNADRTLGGVLNGDAHVQAVEPPAWVTLTDGREALRTAIPLYIITRKV